jgi:hypothetical protein
VSLVFALEHSRKNSLWAPKSKDAACIAFDRIQIGANVAAIRRRA